MTPIRQQLLLLYLDTSALDSRVNGWTVYDGTGATRPTTGDSDAPPYPTGLDALLDGWRVLQVPQLIPPYPGMEHSTSFQIYEFVLEKLVEVAA